MGNAAKAAQRRRRDHAENSSSKSTSQTKANDAARSIVCKTCRHPFLITTRAPALEEHAANKHSKTMADCFPDYTDPNLKK